MWDQARLDAIRARCEAASPGPWSTDFDEINWITRANGTTIYYSYDAAQGDILFTAFARQDIPALLDMLEEERIRANKAAALRDYYKQWVNENVDCCGNTTMIQEAWKTRAKALERALHGCCWACAKATPWEKCADKFPNVVVCKYREYPHAGAVRDCVNWEFDEARYSAGAEEQYACKTN